MVKTMIDVEDPLFATAAFHHIGYKGHDWLQKLGPWSSTAPDVARR